MHLLEANLRLEVGRHLVRLVHERRLTSPVLLPARVVERNDVQRVNAHPIAIRINHQHRVLAERDEVLMRNREFPSV
jgi:hypothetical protein